MLPSNFAVFNYCYFLCFWLQRAEICTNCLNQPVNFLLIFAPNWYIRLLLLWFNSYANEKKCERWRHNESAYFLQLLKTVQNTHYIRDEVQIKLQNLNGDFRHPQSLHPRWGLTYHIANTLVSGRYCIQNEQQGGLTHIWPCLSCQRSWLPFTPDCKFCVKLFWDIIVIQTPLLTMAVFISCLLKDTYCIDLTNFIPSILTYMQFYLHSVQWGRGDGGSWLLAYCLFTRLLISSFPGYFLLAPPLEMSVRHEVGLVDLTNVGKVNVVTCRQK